MATAEAAISAATIRRTKSERRRSDMQNHAKRVCGRGGSRWADGWGLTLPGRRQDEQEAAVIIVRRKQIRDRLGGQIVLRVHGDRFAESAHAPLEGRRYVVLVAGEV